jgi:hypothetical protein
LARRCGSRIQRQGEAPASSNGGRPVRRTSSDIERAGIIYIPVGHVNDGMPDRDSATETARSHDRDLVGRGPAVPQLRPRLCLRALV